MLEAPGAVAALSQGTVRRQASDAFQPSRPRSLSTKRYPQGPRRDTGLARTSPALASKPSGCRDGSAGRAKARCSTANKGKLPTKRWG